MLQKLNLKKLVIGFGLMLMLLCAGVVIVGLRTNAFAKNDDEKLVTDVLTQNAIAVEKGDLAALEKLWANDESVTVFESGHANYGWKDYRDNHLAPELKEMKNVKYALSNVKVKVSGMTAWATFTYSIAANIGERHVEGGGLGTAVLEKRSDKWLIVHWHSSSPRRAPSNQTEPKKNP